MRETAGRGGGTGTKKILFKKTINTSTKMSVSNHRYLKRTKLLYNSTKVAEIQENAYVLLNFQNLSRILNVDEYYLKL